MALRPNLLLTVYRNTLYIKLQSVSAMDKEEIDNRGKSNIKQKQKVREKLQNHPNRCRPLSRLTTQTIRVKTAISSETCDFQKLEDDVLFVKFKDFLPALHGFMDSV